PHTGTVGPDPLGKNFSRALLAPVIQQSRKQDRLITQLDLTAQALERVQAEIRVRRNEIKVPGDAAHLRLIDGYAAPILLCPVEGAKKTHGKVAPGSGRLRMLECVRACPAIP